MNNFINLNNVNRNKKRIVFIDQEMDDPFDQEIIYGNKSIIYEKNYYWSKLNILFDKISKSLNHKVDIAVYPKRKKKINLLKRHFTHNNTLKLIAESQLVITHHSFAMHYAVLLRKPILFVYSSQMIRPGDIECIKKMAKETGSVVFDLTNIDKKKKINFNFKKIFKINKKKYEEYEKNYICFKDRISYGRWKTVLKNLITINQ